MKKGDTLVVPTGITMRLVATGTQPRRAFAVIVYDSSKPPRHATTNDNCIATGIVYEVRDSVPHSHG